MRHPLWKVAAVLLLACTANPVTTHAETFVIREGSIGFDPGDPASFVFRSDGLQLSGLFQPIATSGAFTARPPPVLRGPSSISVPFSVAHCATSFWVRESRQSMGFSTAARLALPDRDSCS